MRFSIGRGIATIALVAFLAACGSTPPNNYYLLSPGAALGETSQSPSLGIGPIHIPEYLNRNGLVYQRDGNQLSISNQERWAEPLANGVTRVISLNLAALLHTENVQGYPWLQRETPDYGVQVSIVSMDAMDDQAKLVAEWIVQKPKDNTVLKRRMSILQADLPDTEPGPQSIPPVYSDLLYQLSEVIAAEIRADL